jgi:hypothetical protein
MPDLQEMLYLRQLLAGGQAWLQLGLLLFLFGVLLFKPERIRLPGLFQWAWMLFALSVMVPPLLTFCVWLFQLTGARSTRSGGPASLLLAVEVASGPVLLGLSLIFAFLALSPRSRPDPRLGPTKHPLE